MSYDETNLESHLPDFDGKLPGDNGYNSIGAQVRHCQEIYGIEFEYHTKRGIRPIIFKGEPRPIQGIEVSPERQVERDHLLDLTRKAYKKPTPKPKDKELEESK